MEEMKKCKTEDELKKVYRKLAMKYHPDRNGGSDEMMKKVNVLYDEMFEKLKGVHETKDGTTYTKETHETSDFFKHIIDELIKLHADIEIEICGLWVWVTGNTFPIKDNLKTLGFKFSRKKTAWYNDMGIQTFHTKHKAYSMEDIRNMWGSEKVEQINKSYCIE